MYKNQCVNSLLERSDLRIHKINAFLKVSLFSFHGLGASCIMHTSSIVAQSFRKNTVSVLVMQIKLLLYFLIFQLYVFSFFVT